MLRSGVRIPPGVIYMEDVAQLVRASVCGTEGRGFESRLPPFIYLTCLGLKLQISIGFTLQVKVL